MDSANTKVNAAPTLTKNRAANLGYWVSTKGAPLDINEMMMLQGFDVDDIVWQNVVSRTAFGGMIGNAQSLTVAKAVLPHLLFHGKLVTKEQFRRMVK